MSKYAQRCRNPLFIEALGETLRHDVRFTLEVTTSRNPLFIEALGETSARHRATQNAQKVVILSSSRHWGRPESKLAKQLLRQASRNPLFIEALGETRR